MNDSIKTLRGISVLLTLSSPLAAQESTSAMDPGVRIAAVDSVAALVEYHYVMPDAGRIIAEHIRMQARSGAYQKTTTLSELAQALTEDLQAVNGDLHLNEAPLLNLEPCEIEGVEGMLRCGTLDVFEDRTAKIGRMISLHLAILPAMSENNAHDPLFILAGGPGQSVINEARGIARDLADVRKHRDIVLVDLRGTGKSNALRCEPDTPQAKLNFLSWSLSDSLVTECLQKFNADPALYTTPILMDDLNEVRAKLGYDQINLYGTSYGTRAALVYARRHPDRVRSLVLRSVAPPGVPIPLLPARHGQAALESRFAECAAEEECRTQFPSLAKNLDEVLTRLSEEPAQARYVDPASGDTSAVSINREIFAGGIQFALYTPFLAKLLPEMIHEAASNNFAPFIQVATPMAEMLPRSISLGPVLLRHLYRRCSVSLADG
ncbi:MAG: alpha/beta fold hydrolase [Balneolaceae bacterium]|nr:alpha/beta fold hydrolase [Balneolaceae bacterium]